MGNKLSDPDFDFPEFNLGKYMLKRFSSFKDKVALIDATSDRKLTYKALSNCIKQFAAALLQLGLEHGDVVATVMPNNIDYPVIYYGVTLIGGIFQPLSPLYTVDQVTSMMKECNTKYAIVDEEAFRKIKSFRDEVKLKVITYGHSKSDCPSFELLLNREDRMPKPVELDPQITPAVLLCSSGTSGLPKAAQLTHFNVLACIHQMKKVTCKVKKGDVAVLFVPLYHVFGLHCALSSELALGMTIVVMSKFTPDEYYSLLQTHKASLIHIVPPVAVMIGKSPLVDNYDLSSVRHVICGAAALNVGIEKKLKERLNLDCIYQGTRCAKKRVLGQQLNKYEDKEFPSLMSFRGEKHKGYGMTEMGVSHANTDLFYKMGSCGKALSGVEVKIEEPKTKVALEANFRGEICIKGPQVMLGYLRRPDANRQIFDEEGWLHTGDVGYVDEDGFLFVVDRLKEIIKCKGNQVPPAYLEDILLKHPGVKDAAVVGIPDSDAGELPKAFVVRNDDMSDLDEQQIYDFVEDRVPPYMKLRGGIEFIKEIPKNPTGKILRRKLREFPVRDENDNIDNETCPLQVYRF